MNVGFIPEIVKVPLVMSIEPVVKRIDG